MVYLGDFIRMRWVNSFLPPGKGKLLDIGCERQLYKRMVEAKGYEWYGIDLYEKIENDSRFKNYTKASATSIPFEDNFFSGALIIDVMEHIKEDMKALKEAFRVLKKGGFLIIHVPHEKQKHLWGKVKPQKDHIREGYTIDSMFKMLTEVGFNRFQAKKTFMNCEGLSWDLLHFKKTLYDLASLDIRKIVDGGYYGLIYIAYK